MATVSVAAVTVSAADLVALPYVAEIVAIDEAQPACGLVETVSVGLVAPAAAVPLARPRRAERYGSERGSSPGHGAWIETQRRESGGQGHGERGGAQGAAVESPDCHRCGGTHRDRVRGHGEICARSPGGHNYAGGDSSDGRVTAGEDDCRAPGRRCRAQGHRSGRRTRADDTGGIQAPG